ncbi:flagellar M-ring protein FliF [bacterium 3DAC]|nr:flagellar M-ring protein FliF [Dictyoglomota bacterium]UZN22961.1 flagellar M-ring protein FliF [bacterium 3DAC]
MKNFIERLKDIQVVKDFLEFWNSLDSARRKQIVAVFVIIFLLLGGLLFWVSRPNYQILYTDLSPDTAASITAYLDQKNIPYKLVDGGRTILVPDKYVDKLRIELAAQGISGKFGDEYSIFDKTRAMFLSQEQERIFEQRVLEQKLTNIIKQLNNVKDARVSIVLPSKNIFAEQVTSTAKASVIVEPKYGARLTDEEVRAIVNLVAGAVDGLTPDQITVADTSGRVLWYPKMYNSGMSFDAIDYKFQIEQRLAFSIETALKEHFISIGIDPSLFDVRVSVNVDVSKVKKVSEDYGDTSTLSLSEKHEREVNGNQGGVVGTAGNVAGTGPTYPYGTGQTSSRTYDEKTVNYEVDKTVTTFEDNGGHVKDVSVSVIFDSDTLKNLKWSAQKIEDIVKAYIQGLGIDTDGEHVVVVPAPVKQLREASAPKGFDWKTFLLTSGVPIGLFLLTTLLAFAFLVMGKSRKEPLPEPQAIIEELLKERGLIEEEELSPEEQREREIIDRIREIIASQPERVAALVKIWLEEEV